MGVTHNKRRPKARQSVAQRMRRIRAQSSTNTQIAPIIEKEEQLQNEVTVVEMQEHVPHADTQEESAVKMQQRLVVEMLDEASGELQTTAQILGKGKHTPFNCSFDDMKVIEEKRIGLCSIFKLKFRFCNKEDDLCTDDLSNSEWLNVNDANVLACISTGIGHTQLVEQHVPTITPYMYAKSFEKISKPIHEAAWENMEKAAKEEARSTRRKKLGGRRNSNDFSSS
ncbi:hypothetical protein FQR65_LT06366 [Abscondita terminalis]|nr:hypothetical protein FQR65_LT06366 [Abscondita terminalis]